MTPLSASQVTAPGAYLWVDHKGISHVGFVTKDVRDRLSGAFISSEGNVRATLFDGLGESSGLFYGPLILTAALTSAQNVSEQVCPPANEDIIAAAIKKHRDGALILAGMGEPPTAEACAEAIARTFARFSLVDEQKFLRDCGIEDVDQVDNARAHEPVGTTRPAKGIDKHISLPGGCGINKF